MCRLFMSYDCSGCGQSILPDEMVMAVLKPRACHREAASNKPELVDDDCATDRRPAIYHSRCFRCVACGTQRLLLSGEQFGIDNGRVYCRAHFCELKLVLSNQRMTAAGESLTLNWLSHPRGGRTNDFRTLSGKVGVTSPTVPKCKTAVRGRPRKIKVVPEVQIEPPEVDRSPQQQATRGADDTDSCGVLSCSVEDKQRDGESLVLLVIKQTTALWFEPHA